MRSLFYAMKPKIPGMVCLKAKVRFSLVAFGWSTTASCKGAVRRPGNYLIVCFRAVMTWVCSPKSAIRSLAACWAISRKLTVMSA